MWMGVAYNTWWPWYFNGIKYQEINGRLVSEGPTPDSSEGNLTYLSSLSHLNNMSHLTSSSSFRTGPENETELVSNFQINKLE